MKTYDPIVAGTKDGSGSFVHDQALLRAATANFKPPNLDTDPDRTVFVGRLSSLASERDVEEIFSGCGTIRFMRLVRNIITGDSRGYAFITFKHGADVRKALALHDSDVHGKRLIVEREVGRTLLGWKPRRLGGGFGGRKESGQMRFGGRACPHILLRKASYSRESLSTRRENVGSSRPKR